MSATFSAQEDTTSARALSRDGIRGLRLAMSLHQRPHRSTATRREFWGRRGGQVERSTKATGRRARRATSGFMPRRSPGNPASTGDGGLAVDADLLSPTTVVSAPDGTIYVAEPSQVRRIDPDGTIHSLFGSSAQELVVNGDAEAPVVSGAIPGWVPAAGTWSLSNPALVPSQGAQYLSARRREHRGRAGAGDRRLRARRSDRRRTDPARVLGSLHA